MLLGIEKAANSKMGASSGVKENDFTEVKISVALSLLAWPITYFVDTGIMQVEENVCIFVYAELNY